MWIYEKRLEYPVRITKPDPRMAKLLMAQYGGPDSELGAGLRYLTQRYSMPDDRIRATLTDIGTSVLPVVLFCKNPLNFTDLLIVFVKYRCSPDNSCKYTSMCSRSFTTIFSRIER